MNSKSATIIIICSISNYHLNMWIRFSLIYTIIRSSDLFFFGCTAGINTYNSTVTVLYMILYQVEYYLIINWKNPPILKHYIIIACGHAITGDIIIITSPNLIYQVHIIVIAPCFFVIVKWIINIYSTIYIYKKYNKRYCARRILVVVYISCNI